MNLSLIPKSTRSAPKKTGALARVYTKDGRSIRVPLRLVQTTTCTTCSQKPERQFMRWFSRQSAANPGFPVMVKSILLVADQKPCANCQRILTSFLYRYNLAGKLRLGVLQSETGSEQQREATEIQGEFDQESDLEFSRRRPYRSMGRARPSQRSRVGTMRPSTPPRRRRSVAHILRQPLITGYQPYLVSDRIYDPEPAPACNCAHSSPVIEEPIVEAPDEQTPDAEPVTNDEIGYKDHARGFNENNQSIQTELDQILNGNAQESESEWYKRLGAPLLAGILTFASPNDSVAKPIIDTTKAWVQHSKAEQERRRKIEEDAAARRKQAKKTQQEVGEHRLLDEIMAETGSTELNQEDKNEQQRATSIVKALVQELRKELISSISKKGRSGSNVRSLIDSRVGAELGRIANSLSSREGLIQEARRHNVSSKTLVNTLRAAGNLMINRAKTNKHPDRREIDT